VLTETASLSRSRRSSVSLSSSGIFLRPSIAEALLGLNAPEGAAKERIAIAQQMLLEFEAALENADDDFILSAGVSLRSRVLVYLLIFLQSKEPS